MAKLNGSVGEGGVNNADDVRLVKIELNRRSAMIGMSQLGESGVYTSDVARMLRRFQALVLRLQNATGLVVPGDQTERGLLFVSPASQMIAAQQSLSSLSGAEWWHVNQGRFPNSREVSDLAPAFSQRTNAFIGALRRAGATVRVGSTRRSRARAYLMHYSWQIATGSLLPSEVPIDEETGIQWDHGDLSTSRMAAQEMVDLFRIVHRPSLTSNHISGTAVDMTIDWTDPIRVVDAKGAAKLIDRPRSAAKNDVLHEVGRSYGVLKLKTDPPHWSHDGR